MTETGGHAREVLHQESLSGGLLQLQHLRKMVSNLSSRARSEQHLLPSSSSRSSSPNQAHNNQQLLQELQLSR